MIVKIFLGLFFTIAAVFIFSQDDWDEGL